MKSRPLALVLALLIGLVGCSDDDKGGPTPPTGTDFSIRILVVDQSNDPVADVAVGAMPALPEWVFPDGPDKDAKSRVTIRFSLTSDRRIRLEVLDVDGQPVRTLVNEVLQPGEHAVWWCGTDNAGGPIPPGYYHVVLLDSPGAEDPFEEIDRKGLVHIPFDPDHYSYGSTCADGELVITDRRLVPHFWNPPAVEACNEEGYAIGVFELSRETWFYLKPPAGDGQWATIIPEDSEQTLTVVLDGKARPLGIPMGGPQLRPAGAGARELIDELLPPCPNPFN